MAEGLGNIVLHRPYYGINTSNSLEGIAHVCYRLLQGQNIVTFTVS